MKRPDNPYIILVEEHDKILDDEQDLFNNKAWKWSEFFWNSKPIYLEIWTWMWNFFSKEAAEQFAKLEWVNFIAIITGNHHWSDGFLKSSNDTYFR